MSNKQLILLDKGNNRDRASFKRTEIMIYAHGTNIPLWKEVKENKVILPGSSFTASKHFAIKPPVTLPTYNEELGLDNIQSITDTEERGALVYLFAVGTDGCGPESSQVYDVDYTKWIAPDSLVPFRYVFDDNDLSDTLRTKYFGRKKISGTDKIAYYFKAFETAPVMYQQYIDGTPIDENIFISANETDVETYVELKLTVTKDDCREYFDATTGINDAKINTISLLTAVPKTIDGYTYYQSIRPLTKLNFPNESLIDLTKGIDIVYHIYY